MKIDFNEAAEMLRRTAGHFTDPSKSRRRLYWLGTALYHILKYLGKRARVICSDEIPKRYDFMRTGYNDGNLNRNL